MSKIKIISKVKAELSEKATTKDYLVVQREGSREVRRNE